MTATAYFRPIVLAADIDLTGWNGAELYPLYNVFIVGDGHKITGLSHCAFVGLHNSGIVDMTFETAAGGADCGGLVVGGTAENCLFENVTVRGKLTGGGVAGDGEGLVNAQTGCTFTNCVYDRPTI